MSQGNENNSTFIGGHEVARSGDINDGPEEALRRERLRSFGHFAKQHIWSDEEWDLIQRYFDVLNKTELLINSDLITRYLNNAYESMVTDSVWEPEIPSGETIIRRYMRFDKFLMLLKDKALWFSRSDVFEDDYEGTFPTTNIGKQREIDQQRLNMVGIPQELLDSEEYATNQELEQDNRVTYINCWRWGEDESAVFWNAYIGEGLGVAIETTVDQFKEAINMDVSTGHADIETLRDRTMLKSGFDHLRYDLEDLLILELSKLQIGKIIYIDYNRDFMPNSDFSRFFHKRNAFSDEQEFRALFRKPSLRYSEKNNRKGTHISVDLDHMINKIWLKPNSPDWFEKLVDSSIKYYGFDQDLVRKSKLDNLKPNQAKAAPAANYSRIGFGSENRKKKFKIEGRFISSDQILPPLHEKPLQEYK